MSGAVDLRSAISRAWTLSEQETAQLTERLAQVLAAGDFVYIVAARVHVQTLCRPHAEDSLIDALETLIQATQNQR
jgi:hypothetical protein